MSMNAHHCCIVFSNERSIAEQKLDAILKSKTFLNINRIFSQRYETGARDIYEDEEWIWVMPNANCRCKRAHKTYIDVNCSIKELQQVIEPMYALYCKREDIKYFNW